MGSQRQKQSLIVDTGSGIAAVPCKNYCKSCGPDHLNDYFDVKSSLSKYFYDCHKDQGCTCDRDGKCSFLQKYGEGSLYKGFIVKDSVHFGDHYHAGLDSF